ncbi:beta-phosphoglucomutase family hydrolase [Jatrophihabitans sp. YIM 134969]
MWTVLGLPDGVTALLFDLDGVLTQTAKVHFAAWKQTFDEVLTAHGDDRPFTQDDYNTYVDGKPREDGVRDFLASRDIHPDRGAVDDSADTPTIFGIGNRKNDLLLEKIHQDGVETYAGSVRYLDAAIAAGLRRAVVSASKNTEDVLKVTGLRDKVEIVVDGNTVAAKGLAGKPAPDPYLEGARELGVPASAAAVFEDALAGVEAGRAGHFGYVIGVNRVDQADALKAHGADVVVDDLSDLLDDAPEASS